MNGFFIVQKAESTERRWSFWHYRFFYVEALSPTIGELPRAEPPRSGVVAGTRYIQNKENTTITSDQKKNYH